MLHRVRTSLAAVAVLLGLLVTVPAAPRTTDPASTPVSVAETMTGSPSPAEDPSPSDDGIGTLSPGSMPPWAVAVVALGIVGGVVALLVRFRRTSRLGE